MPFLLWFIATTYMIFDQIYLWHVSHCRFHIPGAIWVEYNEIGHYYYNRNFNFTRSRNSRGVNNYLRSDNLYISPFCRDDNVKRCSVKCGKCQVIISEIIITSIELHWYLGGADMLPPQPRGVQNIQVTTTKYYSWELKYFCCRITRSLKMHIYSLRWLAKLNFMPEVGS